jgi:serine/threonine protein kinase
MNNADRVLDTGSQHLLPPLFGEKEEVLGRGGSATVLKLYVSDPRGFKKVSAGQYIAVKKIAFVTGESQMSPDDLQRLDDIRREVAMLKTLHHPNIVEYYGVYVDQLGFLNICLEYCEGNSIRHVYKKNGPLSEAVVQSYTYQILEGLAFLHSKGIVHRDIKGFNVLLSRDGNCKLADFGCAVNVSGKKDGQFHSMEGTVWWMAPEVLQISQQRGASVAADIWSVGCTILEMLTGTKPFDHCSGEYQLMRHVLETEPEIDIVIPEIAAKLSPGALNLIRRCLRRDPQNRPTARELQQDPFFTSYVERLRSQQQSHVRRPDPSLSSAIQLSGSGQATTYTLSPKLESARAWWEERVAECNGAGGSATIPAHVLFHNCFKAPHLLGELLPLIKFGSTTPLSTPTSGSTPALYQGDGSAVGVSPEDFFRFMEWFGPLDRFLKDCAALEDDYRKEIALAGSGRRSSQQPRSSAGYDAASRYNGYGYGYYGNDDDIHMLLTLRSREWFQPILTQKDAEHRMSSAVTGTFAIRYTSKYAQFPGGFTLSVKGERGVNHYRILRPEDGESWSLIFDAGPSQTQNLGGSRGGAGQPHSPIHGATATGPTVSNTFSLSESAALNQSQSHLLYFDSLEELVDYGYKVGFRSQRSDRVYKLVGALPR